MGVLSGDDPGLGECHSTPTGKPPTGQGLRLAGSGGAEEDCGDGSSASQTEGSGAEEKEEDYEDLEDFLELPDTRSVASDDSFYPPLLGDDDDDDWSLGESETDSLEPLSLFRACCSNNAVILRALIHQGPEEDEVQETDCNKRTGLIIACYQGFVDIVVALAQCPHVDVNWQDNEGNTALITAAQAGHITITHYLLNYYPGLDIEKRNIFGFTALMKSAMQGRTECVRALMLAGASIHAADPGRGLTAEEWAWFTGRVDSARLMRRLVDRPCAEQFCDQFELEWPRLKELLSKPTESKSCFQRISEGVRSVMRFKASHEPEEDGVLDHMVKVTTSLRSSFVGVACKTVCPGSPPGIGKCRPAVQEILRRKRAHEIRYLEDKDHLNSYEKLFQNSRVTLVSKKKERRASLQPINLYFPPVGIVIPRKSSLLPLHLLRRRSVRPGFVIPKVRITKAPLPTFQPDQVQQKSFLQIPKWRYQELREEKKKAEEEKQQAEEAEKQKQGFPQRNRT
ncbi:ankyrin repeat domain-containing protein 33B isoform X2 [Paroedura picta]|uniref:ankyrin repeat domain-containing protein 33B isoform X2 n=1 Tax=Paroedura picta TaxID=143630 RepID=UPI004055BF6A